MSVTSLMQLEATRLRNLSIQTRELESIGEAEFEKDVTLNFHIDSKKNSEEGRYLVSLELALEWDVDEPSPFERISIGLDGIFKFPNETSAEEIEKYIPILGITNLLGFARGIIAQATSICESGAYILPLFNANELLKEQLREKTKQRSSGGTESANDTLISSES